MEYDVAIVGGGASALVASITLGRRGKTVALLERQDRVGKKILKTGNGRCNITNKNLSKNRYHGKNIPFIMNVLQRVGYAETEAFFKSIGIILAEDGGGKMYPMSFQASSVLDLLRSEVSRLGIGEITGFFVNKIEKKNDKFYMFSGDGKKIIAKRVIVATGGMASPQDGSDGNGYRLLEAFGHTLVRPVPSLVQLKAEVPFRALKGVKQDGSVTVYVGGKACRTEVGEVLFTDYGISGPPVFNISQIAAEALDSGKEVFVGINFLPHMERGSAAELLKTRKNMLPHLFGEDFLNGIVNKRLGKQIMKECKSCDDAAEKITNFTVKISGTMSFKNAQATTGGIDTADFDAETMESYLESGLYAAGEVLDVVGDCGGYNLQWAWSSGIVAGEAAAE